MKRLIGGNIIDIVEDSNGMVEASYLRGATGIGNDQLLTIERGDGSMALVPARGKVNMPADAAVIARINGERG